MRKAIQTHHVFKLQHLWYNIESMLEKAAIHGGEEMTQEEKMQIQDLLYGFVKDPKIQQMSTFIQHGNVTCLEHCISVAYFSYAFCKQFHIKADVESLVRGALLHDYFLYDWHIKEEPRKLHGFYHPIAALKNAEKDFELSKKERDIIVNHMWPLTILHIPLCRESLIVCMMDKLCSTCETFGWSLFQYTYRKG